MFCKVGKIFLPFKDRVNEKFEAMVRQNILDSMQPGGVTKASPGVWPGNINRALRRGVDLKVHNNGEVMGKSF